MQMNNSTANQVLNRSASIAWMAAELASVSAEYAAQLWHDYHVALDRCEAFGVALQIAVERDLAERRLEQVIWSLE